MKTKEEFLAEMGNFWDRLQTIEQRSTDLYEFEENFEKEMNQLGKETMQSIVGSESRDRRVKKKLQTRYGEIALIYGAYINIIKTGHIQKLVLIYKQVWFIWVNIRIMKKACHCYIGFMG